MAAAGGRQDSGLSGTLLREPYRFDFFQAVRLLERLLRDRAGDDPARRRHPVGHDRPPEQEVVRFRALPALSFPAGEVAKVRPPDEGADGPFEMLVSFLGLTGPNGALPRHYTALLLARIREKDHSLRDWLDLFNHRAVSLFYRAWEKNRLPAAYERAKLEPGAEEDAGTRGLFSLVGLGTPGLRGRRSADDEVFVHYAGHFAHEPRNAAALEGLLGEYFEMPVAVLQLFGQWLYLDDENRAMLPGPGAAKGFNNRLGEDVVVGGRVWDVQSKFRVRVGPLAYAQFRRLMPSGDGLRPLAELTRAYVGPEFDFDVQVFLAPAEVPWGRLVHDEDEGPRLGWNAWARTHDAAGPVGDAVFAEAVTRGGFSS